MTRFSGTKLFLRCLGRYKDGFTTFLALIFFVVGFYQYLEFRSDKKVEAALDILKRRESAIFVDARTTLMAEWFGAQGALREELESTDEYTEELLDQIRDRIVASGKYREAMLHISAYYSNAAACALDGYCHAPTICASLAGEIQDFYEVSENYLAYLYKLRKEDALTLILDQPEFVAMCDGNIGLNYFGRTDQGLLCSLGKKVYNATGFGWPASACDPTSNAVISKIIRKSEELP